MLALRDVLGPSSARVEQFVVQQSDDSPEPDEVMITFSRVSPQEYTAICEQLRQCSGVKACRDNGTQR